MLGNYRDLAILKQTSFQLSKVDSQESTDYFLKGVVILPLRFKENQ